MSAENHKDPLPYRLRDRFLSSIELSLFRSLLEMAEDRYVICPKVALNDIFYILRPNENVHFYSKIFRKHVDFLLCDPESMNPAFAVDIVKPISKNEARASDQFMEDLFLSAGLPLIHVPSSETYEMTDLVHLFQLSITKVNNSEGQREPAEGESVPLCPECGLMMVLRVHRNGSRVGKKYYGCMNSPACPGMVAID